tara:strand:+ start:353 stop:547 length:195 start_codon:yes stop_codon:yes gene_type:complete
MEQLNLGDAIAQLKVLRWQYDEANELDTPESVDAKFDLLSRIMETIDMIDIPELVGQGGFNEYL